MSVTPRLGQWPNRRSLSQRPALGWRRGGAFWQQGRRFRRQVRQRRSAPDGQRGRAPPVDHSRCRRRRRNPDRDGWSDSGTPALALFAGSLIRSSAHATLSRGAIQAVAARATLRAFVAHCHDPHLRVGRRTANSIQLGSSTNASLYKIANCNPLRSEHCFYLNITIPNQ